MLKKLPLNNNSIALTKLVYASSYIKWKIEVQYSLK